MSVKSRLVILGSRICTPFTSHWPIKMPVKGRVKGFSYPDFAPNNTLASESVFQQKFCQNQDSHVNGAHDALSLKLALALRLFLTLCPLVCIMDMMTSASTDMLTISILFCLCASMLMSMLLLSLEHIALAQVFSTMGLMVTSFAIALIDANNMTSLSWLLLIPLDAILFLQNTSMTRAMMSLAVAVIIVGAYLGSGFSFTDLPIQTTGAIGFVLPAFIFSCIFVLVICILSHRLQRDVRHALTRYNALVSTTGDDVLVCDKYGDVLTVCGSDENVLLSQLDLSHLSLFDRVHIADRPAFLKSLSDAMNKGGVVMTRLRLNIRAQNEEATSDLVVPDYKSNQSFTWIEMRARALDGLSSFIGEAFLNKALFSSNELNPVKQNPPAIIMSLRNIDSFIAHEEQIEAAKSEAQQANALKDRLLANVSHELRTPLNAIIGFSELLSSPTLAPKDPLKQREYANIIHSSSQHLLSVVNSILDMSKIEAGSFEIITDAFELQEFITSCCDIIRLRAQEKSITLSQKIDANVVSELIADKRACKQILINLLSNAVKFTPEGGQISVVVQQDGNYVRISVIDTGIGIASNDMSRLGDAFFQARGSYDRPYEGTGLGLSVVRGLVGLHGGTISVESEQGKGTHVCVVLPVDCRKSANRFLSPVKIETITRISSKPHNIVARAVGLPSSENDVRKTA